MGARVRIGAAIAASAIIAVVVGATAPARAEVLSDKAWKAFLDTTFARFDGKPGAGDFEDQLYLAATHSRTRAEAMADFARRLHLEPARAAADAALIVHAVNTYHDCWAGCLFHPGVNVYDEAARVAVDEPSGQLMLDVLKVAGESDPANVIRLAWRHPKAAGILLDLAGYTGKAYYFGAAMAKLPDDPLAPPPVLTGEPFSSTPDETSGLVPALVEVTATRMADTPNGRAWRVALTQWALRQELEAGLDDDAAGRYLGLLPVIRAALPVAPLPAGDDRCSQAEGDFDFATAMAAALWRHGNHDEARALLGQAWPTGLPVSVSARASLDMIGDAMTPSIADKELFRLYILGRSLAGAEAAEGGCDKGGHSEDGPGWLFSAQNDAPAIRHLVAARLAAAGNRDMAHWLDSRTLNDNDSGAPAVLASLAADLPADARARQGEWAARLTEASQAAQAAAAGPVHVILTTLTPPWTQKPLPAGMSPWRDSDKAPAIPKGAKLPVPADAIVRYEASGTNAAIVYESSEYDLSGEIPAAGLWLALRRGGVWQKSLYLGLQTHFPYEVTRGSHLPLIAGDRLQLEVRVREIDPKSITFPPVGLSYSRKVDSLYLDMSLADLARDSDGDGLTDIEEARLGLDPHNRDTDGDGVVDGDDVLPLTAYNAKTDPRTTAVAKLILARLIGHDAAAHIVSPAPGGEAAQIAAAMGHSAPDVRRNTFFVVSDTDIFSGILGAPFQLIVYSQADLDRLARKAPFFPPRIVSLFASPDGADYYVNWSANWVGGAFLVHCDGVDCKITDTLSDWIT